MSFYLGPRQPRRHLDTWEQVIAAAADGMLEEDQWVELKQHLPTAGQGKSKKDSSLTLAEDLASLSADGGVLIVGIADDHGQAGEVTGTPLQGVHTRISQVAVTNVHPPLTVSINVAAKPGEPEIGVVVVSVPASAEAPHMVGGRFWGRSAEGKTPLSEAQVQRLYAQRAAATAGFEERLRALVEHEPPAVAEQSRLYLRIEPSTPAAQPLTRALNVAGERSLSSVIYQAPLESLYASPNLVGSLVHPVPHADGLAAVSITGQDATEVEHHLFLLLRDDGGLDLCAPASRTPNEGHSAVGWVTAPSLVETVHNALALVAHLANEHTGYQGSWQVGLLATHLRGLVAPNPEGWRDPQPYAAERYTRAVTTTTQEITEDTPAVVTNLMENLLRGLSASRYLPYTDVGDLWKMRR